MADQDHWQPLSPAQVFAHLARVELPWAVVGGWALDLWQGQQSRDHEDIEIAVLRPDLGAFFEALGNYDVFCVRSGDIWPLNGHPPADVTQFWCRNPDHGAFVLDIMVERGTPRIWVYKRDKRIRRTRAEAMAHDAQGIPYLNPACVLLFKAKALREKDRADFMRVAPLLNVDDRAWLKHALQVTHPGHPWLHLL